MTAVRTLLVAAMVSSSGCTLEAVCPGSPAYTWRQCLGVVEGDAGFDAGAGNLTAEIAVTDQVLWPAGGVASAVNTSAGTMISMLDKGTALIRVLRPDGSLSEPVSLGQVYPTAPVALTATSKGVLAVYWLFNTAVLMTQLLDPATGQPTAPKRALFQGSPSVTPTFVGRTAEGTIFFIGYSFADGGTETTLRALDDEGALAFEPLDVGLYGTPVGVAGEWAGFSAYYADGGTLFSAIKVGATPTGLVALQTAALNKRVFGLASSGTRVMGVVQSLDGGMEAQFFDGQGMPAGASALPENFVQFTAAALGDEVLLGVAERGPGAGAFKPSRLSLVRLFSDGGTARSELFAGDGGELEGAALVLDSTPPRLLFTRLYSELSFGTWRSTWQLPLTASLDAAAQEATPLWVRPTTQLSPSFSTRVEGEPIALAWSHDRQLPDKWLLEATRVTAAGQLVGPSTALEQLRFDFTGVPSTGRIIANGDEGFVATRSNGFLVQPIDWPGDGGAPVARTALTDFGIFQPPFIAAVPGGFWVSWDRVGTGLQARRLNRQGTSQTGTYGPLRGQAVRDVWGDLQLISSAADETLVMTRMADTGQAELGAWSVSDGGVRDARFVFGGTTGLVVWQRTAGDGLVAHINSARLELDGGPLDRAPVQFEVPSRQFASNLYDVGFKEGVFYVFGKSFTDAGVETWVYRRPADGGVLDATPQVLELGEVGSLTVGPSVPDAGLLFAYTRVQPWPIRVERLYVRMLLTP